MFGEWGGVGIDRGMGEKTGGKEAKNLIYLKQQQKDNFK